MSTISEQYTQSASVKTAPNEWWADPSAQLYRASSPDESGRETGVTRPYHEAVADMMKQMTGLSLDGAASIPVAADGLSGERGTNRELTYAEIAAKGKGHKLHIAFNQEDPAKATQVKDLLDELVAQGGITTYKVGQNSGQEGKDATLYVGHKDKALLVAGLLSQELADLLNEPEGDVLESDVVYAPKVMGRFEVQGLDSEFHQYGAEGFPLRNDDVGQLSMLQLEGVSPEAQSALLLSAEQRAEETLCARYGTFYTGTPD